MKFVTKAGINILHNCHLHPSKSCQFVPAPEIYKGITVDKHQNTKVRFNCSSQEFFSLPGANQIELEIAQDLNCNISWRQFGHISFAEFYCYIWPQREHQILQ